MRVKPDDISDESAILQRMTKQPAITDELLGARETRSAEPKTLDAFLVKARALGFSDDELARLRSYFEAPGETGLARHKTGGGGN